MNPLEKFFTHDLPDRFAADSGLSQKVIGYFRFEIEGGDSWAIEMVGNGRVTRHGSLPPMHTVTISSSEDSLESLLSNPISAWQMFINGEIRATNVCKSIELLEAVFPGTLNKSVPKNLLSALRPMLRGQLGDELSQHEDDAVDRFLNEELPEIIGKVDIIKSLQTVFKVEIEGQGIYTLDLLDKPSLMEGAPDCEHSNIAICRSDLIQVIENPKSVWSLFLEGRIRFDDPCRTVRLMDTIWPGSIGNALPRALIGALFFPTQTAEPGQCEQSGGPVDRYSYIVAKDGYEKVWYSDVDGQAVYQGDIILGTTQEMETIKKSVENNGGSLQGFRIIDWTDPTKYVWPSNTMTYDDSASSRKSLIADAISYISSKTNVQFTAGSTGDYVEFVDGSGCSSDSIGMKTGKQTITLSSSCSKGNVIHEICHALGLFHEQQRQDRNTYVTINTENIISGKESNFDKKPADTSEDLDDYDYLSIMHYGQYFFAKKDDKDKYVGPTITCKQSSFQDKIGQRDGFSSGDISALNEIYP